MDFDAVAIRSSSVMGFACFFRLPIIGLSYPVTAYWWETDIVQGSDGTHIDYMRLGFDQQCYSAYGAGLGGAGTCPNMQTNQDQHISWRVEPQGVNSPTTFHMEFIWGVNPIPDNCLGTTLSSIAQAVLAKVNPQMMYCGNKYDRFITLPYDDDVITPTPAQAAFTRFGDLAREARYEIDFTTMIWDPEAETETPNVIDSQGEFFLQGVKDLYEGVKNPASIGKPADYYAAGVHVRILIGIEFYGGPSFDQGRTVIEDLERLGIDRDKPEYNWTVEIATINKIGTHSHVKSMIVDGQQVIVGGYNVDDDFTKNLEPHHDMGAEVSGPVAQDALKVFDRLWLRAKICGNDICNQDIPISSIAHLPEVQNPSPSPAGITPVFSLFRDDTDKTADDAIAATIGAATSEVNIIQFNFTNNIYDPPQYARAILDILQNGVDVNILVSNGKTDKPFNAYGICALKSRLILEDPFGTHNLSARFSDHPMHTKALSIDREFIIVGSQNFNFTAWGNTNWDWDLAEYSLGVDSTTAATEFNDAFITESSNSSAVACFGIDLLESVLQDAIDQVAPGTTIFLPAGVYTEPVTINKPLTIVGAGGGQTVMQLSGNQPAFRITSSDVTIANMKISGGAGYGIELIDSSPSSLRNIQINNVVFENNAQGGILAQGLIPGSPMNYTIENNTFIGGADGVAVNMVETQADTSFIRNNIFSGQTNVPIHVLSADDSRVEYSYNLFYDCGLGACSVNWIQGNISASSSAHDNLFDLDPLFSSPENGAYQLTTGSPAVDTGDPSILHEFFFDGDNDGFIRIDMGAFEYAPIEENAAPVIDTGTDQTIQLGSPVTIVATYTDADNSENHSARIDWGDGIVKDVPVTMTGPGTGEVESEHTYVNAGNYTVEVCAIDLYGSVGCDILNIVVSSFPSSAVLDNFNRANGGMGHNWTGNKSKYTINANQLKVISNDSNSDIYWASQAFGADQEAYFTFSDVSGTATEQDLLLKSQSNTTWGHGVLEVWYDALNQRAQVWTYEWHAGWVQHGADIPVTFADGDQFGARAFADGTVEVYKNGTLLATRDVTSWLYYDQGGYIGLWFIGAQNARVDDFGGGTISSSAMQSMIAGATTERTVTSDQLDVTINAAAQFWQGIPLKANQTASVTFDSLQASIKPQSNGVWGEGTAQLLYDVPNQRIQVWQYDAVKGWMQVGKDIPVKFTAGDTFTVRILSDGTLELSRNGKVIIKRKVGT